VTPIMAPRTLKEARMLRFEDTRTRNRKRIVDGGRQKKQTRRAARSRSKPGGEGVGTRRRPRRCDARHQGLRSSSSPLASTTLRTGHWRPRLVLGLERIRCRRPSGRWALDEPVALQVDARRTTNDRHELPAQPGEIVVHSLAPATVVIGRRWMAIVPFVPESGTMRVVCSSCPVPGRERRERQGPGAPPVGDRRELTRRDRLNLTHR